jgi:hypothetical protein
VLEVVDVDGVDVDEVMGAAEVDTSIGKTISGATLEELNGATLVDNSEELVGEVEETAVVLVVVVVVVVVVVEEVTSGATLEDVSGADVVELVFEGARVVVVNEAALEVTGARVVEVASVDETTGATVVVVTGAAVVVTGATVVGSARICLESSLTPRRDSNLSASDFLTCPP